MKKITFFVYDIYQMGGIEKVVTLIANELSKKYEVEIISLYKREDTPFYKLNDNIKVWNILHRQLNPIKLYYPYLKYKTYKALKNVKTDVFICAGMGYVGLNIFMRKKAKYIAWEHSSSLQGKTGGIMWLGRRLAAKYADKIVVLTEEDKNINVNKYNTLSKIAQIYNPIEEIKNYYEYKIESKLILSAGRLSNEKGFDMLIDVADKVLKKHPTWQWHIYGEGIERETLQNLINEKKLQENLKLMGKTDKMNDVYNEYSIFVLTSRHEGLGMVNLEAHYAKLPVVSFDCEVGPREIIEDNVNGYLIDCFDIDNMAKKINYLIENPEIRLEMSKNTMIDKEKFSMKNVIEKWEKIL